VSPGQAGQKIRIVPLYDGFDQARGGPYFEPDRPRIDDPSERERVADFMRDGAVVLRSTALDVDAVEPTRGTVVPGSFRTDGQWIWSDGLMYYVREHGIAPAAEFYSHVVACQYRCADPGAAGLREATQMLVRR